MIAISEKEEKCTKRFHAGSTFRGVFKTILEEWIRKSISNSKENFHYTMVLLDVDHFKQINDSCGHLSGDEAIKIVGSALFSCVRTTDYVIRYGGDEFMLL